MKKLTEGIKYYWQSLDDCLLFALLYPVIWIGKRLRGERSLRLAR